MDQYHTYKNQGNNIIQYLSDLKNSTSQSHIEVNNAIMSQANPPPKPNQARPEATPYPNPLRDDIDLVAYYGSRPGYPSPAGTINVIAHCHCEITQILCDNEAYRHVALYRVENKVHGFIHTNKANCQCPKLVYADSPNATFQRVFARILPYKPDQYLKDLPGNLRCYACDTFEAREVYKPGHHPRGGAALHIVQETGH